MSPIVPDVNLGDDANPFGEVIDRTLLDDIEDTGFWDTTPQLQLIAERAAQKRVSAWGLLAICLAHRASHVPPNVVIVERDGSVGTNNVLSEGTSANGFYGLVARPGGGKSVTFRLGSSLIPPNGMPLPDGTGQGLVKAISETVKVTKDEEGKPLKDPYMVTRFHRHSLTLHAPEVKTLNAEFAREGTKTASILRSMWVGETLGMTNADKERNASIPANMARIIGIWGVQPQNAVAILDQSGDGTPQRFLWAPAEEYRRGARAPKRTPAPPLTTFPFPVFGTTPPGIAMGSSLPKEVRVTDDGSAADESDLPTPIWVHWSPQMATDINAFYAAEDAAFDRDPYADLSAEQEVEEEALTMEAHLLLMRIKIAVWVGWLHGRAEPADIDWYLSGLILEVSVAELAGIWKMCRREEKKEASRRGVNRAFEMDATDTARGVIKDDRLEQVSEAAYSKLAARGPLREYQLKQSAGKQQRPLVRDALRHLEDNGRAEYDGTFWYAVYKGNKLRKQD